MLGEIRLVKTEKGARRSRNRKWPMSSAVIASQLRRALPGNEACLCVSEQSNWACVDGGACSEPISSLLCEEDVRTVCVL